MSFRKVLIVLFFILSISRCKSASQDTHRLLPPRRIGAPTHKINGEHISAEFYSAVENAAKAKQSLQNILHNFLENLQRNLTTSAVLRTVVNTVDVERTQRQLQKLTDLAMFFQIASERAGNFALKAEHFFQVAKNESSALLAKLRQVPTAQRFLPTQAKLHLTNYFAEMEFFHVMFCEVTDVALEYIVDTLRAVQRTFIRYADIQRDVLHYWNFKPDEWCCNRYMDFLQQWSAEIYKCSSANKLNTAYDVYATTEVTAKYFMRQLEFRIQRLFNCFLFGDHQIRCRFLHHAEKDFERLFDKLEELQMYYDIKTSRGRVETFRYHRRRRGFESFLTDDENEATISKSLESQDKCIPFGFPETQMLSSLKACFYFLDFN